MNIAIFDKGDGEFLPKCFAQAAVVFGMDNVEAGDPLTWGDPVARLRDAQCALGHLTTEQFGSLVANPPATLQAVVRVSSVGAGWMEPCRLNADGLWILHLIDRSGALTEEKWKELWLGIQQWNTQSEPTGALALFFTADHVEELWTLHALCEAAQMAELNPGGPIQKPTDWLGPFDQRSRPGGLFDDKGEGVHQTFMKARKSANPSEPTMSNIADCLKAVIDELVVLKQIP